jgi:serine/threonine protein phosphatase PrpC
MIEKIHFHPKADKGLPMGVTCPACGGLSQDREFCDHCNADLLPPASSLCPSCCPLFVDEAVSLTPEQVALLSRPETATLIRARNQAWRVHWLPQQTWEASRAALEERQRHSLRCLPPCRLAIEEDGCWVFVDAAPARIRPWSEHVADDPIEDLRRLGRFLEPLARSLEELHERHLVWLTFDPREIEEVDGCLRFTNMDLAVYPARKVPERLQATPSFAAPEVARFQGGDLGPATDVFHLALFAYYWLAGLLPYGFAGKGLESFGHSFPPLRTFARALPPGVAGVVARGLALEPRHRYPSPIAFCTALEKARARAERRWAHTAPVLWDIGLHTRVGRAKAARNRDNEDHVLARTFAGPDRALLAVADGITTCDIGSGALASLITCVILENAFDSESRHDSFPDRITEVSREGSETLLNWAIEKGYRDQLAAGRDLMGSTLLAGWLEGNALILANVGDSRAYLIDGPVIEQLTVDGDLGSELLTAGVPPEDVRSLGTMARGLRDCVGGCSVTADGELQIRDDFCRPALSRWPLLPGDVLVLCSDGLVEESAFLEPATMGEIVRSHPHLSADALAVQLAEAADALQRLPSSAEPDGFGDNISCIVIKIANA